MKEIRRVPESVTLALIVLIFFLPSCTKKSYLENDNGLEVLHLSGSPVERGQAHGTLLREEIASSVDRWKTEVEQVFQCDLDTAIGEFFASTTYLACIGESDPGLLQEVHGMSVASGVDYNRLLAFQMSEEMFAVLGEEGPVSCTAIGQKGTDTASTLLAQNMDPELFLHGHPILMHVVPGDGGPERYLFTVPGLLGLAGMNDRGIGVTCTSISMLNHDSGGLPVVSVVRNMLSGRSLDEVITFLTETSFAIPQCYTIGGPGEVRCFECSANMVTEFYPFTTREIVLHTNHAITNRDFNQGFLELLAGYGKTVDDPYFCPRYFLAYDFIEEAGRVLDVERIKEILRSQEPEMEPILNQYTLGTLVMKLDNDPVLFLALGNEPGAEFHRLEFP